MHNYSSLFPAGQKQAVRLARQANKQTRRIKNKLAKYNAELLLLKEHIMIPAKSITFLETKDLNSSLFHRLRSDELKSIDSIPFSTKRCIIELTDPMTRCDEEEAFLRQECETLLESKLSCISLMLERIKLLAETGDAFSVGFLASLRCHIIQLKCNIDSDKVTSKAFDISVLDMEYSESIVCPFLAEVKYNDVADQSDDESDIESQSDDDFEDEFIFDNED